MQRLSLKENIRNIVVPRRGTKPLQTEMGGTLFIDYHFFLLSFGSCEFKEYNTNLKGILSDLMHAIATLNK